MKNLVNHLHLSGLIVALIVITATVVAQPLAVAARPAPEPTYRVLHRWYASTGGAHAEFSLKQRTSDGAVYFTVTLTDDHADGLCAHAMILWDHREAGYIPEYGMWVCGNGTSKVFTTGARDWTSYRGIKHMGVMLDGADYITVGFPRSYSFSCWCAYS